MEIIELNPTIKIYIHETYDVSLEKKKKLDFILSIKGKFWSTM